MAPLLLIIDDEKNMRLLYKQQLQSEGFKVDLAESGNEALSMLESATYDLIILDIEMPGISGLELISKLKEKVPNTPVILCTAYSTYKADFKTWLADAYIMKSSDMEPLKKEISNLLKKAAKIGR